MRLYSAKMMSPRVMIPTRTPFSTTGRRLTLRLIMDFRISMIEASGVVVRTVRVMTSDTGLLEISSEIAWRRSSAPSEASMA